MSNMSRRDAVRIVALAPIAGTLEWTGADIGRAAEMVRTLARGSQGYAPQFFTPHEWRTLTILVDYIIPRDERSGSATEAKVPEFIDFMLSDKDTATSDATRNAMRDGLAWLDAECGRRFSQQFAECSDEQRRGVLDDIAWARRASGAPSEGVAYFNRFRDMTAAGFFSSRMGWEDLEYQGHTFVPVWEGCPEGALRKLGVSYDLMNTRVPVERK